MQRGCPSDRAERIVRRYGDGYGLDHRRDFLRLQQSTAMTDVGLNDVDRARGEKVMEFYPIDKPFAGSQRNA